MKRQSFGLLLLLMILAAGSMPAAAQVTAPPAEPETLRFEFMAHNFIVDGIEQEVYLKLDRFTGRTWRFYVGNPRWNLIPEATEGNPRAAGSVPRYELLPHNYLDQNGDHQEVIIRADGVTGYSWLYRGAAGSWKDIAQEN